MIVVDYSSYVVFRSFLGLCGLSHYSINDDDDDDDDDDDVIPVVAINSLKGSSIRWLHFEVFSAIQV